MLDEFCVLDRSTTISCGSFLVCDLSTRDIRMRSELQHNQITHAQTVDDNLNDVSAGTHGVEADFSEGDMLASLEVVLHWLGSAVAVAFIGLAIIEPVRVERTLTSLMFKARDLQIADVGWAAERVERTLTSLIFKVRDIQIADVGWAAV